jgi:integrase
VLGGVSKTTLQRYHAVCDKHIEFCRLRNVSSWSDIDKHSIGQYGSHLKKLSYSDATIYLECTLLKQIIKWLIDDQKILAESHRVRLPLRRSHETSTYCFSRDEVEAILRHCWSNESLHWLGYLLFTLAHTGIRIGEAASLRWSDVDREFKMITIVDDRHNSASTNSPRTTKGRRSRKIPAHPALDAMLDQMPRRKDGKVFGGPQGGILKADTARIVLVRDVLEPLKEKFPTPAGDKGFKHGRLHSFRHFFVSQAFSEGASEGDIREWVGHTNSRLTERYRHLRDQESQCRMRKLSFLDSTIPSYNSTMTSREIIADD